MPTIELIVAVCLTAQPNVCFDKHIPFLERTSIVSCMVQAQPFLAGWSVRNREYIIKTWKCGYPGEREEKA